MSDRYIGISFDIELSSEAGAYAKMLADTVDILGNDGEIPDDIPDEIVAAANEIAIDEHTTGCIWEYSRGTLCVYHDGSAWVEGVAAIIQATLSKFSIEEPVVIEWANCCSEPITDAFGGGAVVVTKDDLHWMSTAQWVEDKLEELFPSI